MKLRNGASFPLCGLGTWQSRPGEVEAAVTHFVQQGGRHIDGAAGYNNETEVGRAIAGLISGGTVTREELFITSKLWVMSARPGDCAAALTKTLADLCTSYVDLYLIHWPFSLPLASQFPPPMEAITPYDAANYLALWRALEAEVDAGRIRALGCSNMSVSKLAALEREARHPICANQVECHPSLPQNELRAWCSAHGVALTAYSPLGSPDRPPRWQKEGNPVPLQAPAVLAAAARAGRTPAQVLLRWQLQRGVAAIPKSITPARITENLQAALGEDLDAETMAALAALELPNDAGRIIIGCACGVGGRGPAVPVVALTLFFFLQPPPHHPHSLSPPTPYALVSPAFLVPCLSSPQTDPAAGQVWQDLWK
jgi:alcohol dehydrogenase (NADP+)